MMSGSVRVMSLNLRYDNPLDGPNAWPHRRDWLAEIVRREAAEMIGMQEARRPMIDDLTRRLPLMGWYGRGRDDGQDGGEFVPVFWNRERFEPEGRGVFWLSETPEMPGSRGWSAPLPRITTWVQLRERGTGRTLTVFNTHLDYESPASREQAARLIRERMRPHTESDLLLLTGDLNSTLADPPLQILTAPTDAGTPFLYDSRAVSHEPPTGPDSTWNGFRQIVPGRRIDYILTHRPEVVRRHATLADQADGRFPTDHLPVLAECAFGGG
jgi:endonuclease/exonuclease/phosphatase family metal-dependent hydrolase